MSTAVTRPNQLISGGGVTVVGGVSLVEALSDGLDTTYAIFTHADHAYLGFTEPASIPAGAKVKSGQLRIRARKVDTSAGSMRPNYRMRDPYPSQTNIYGFNQDAAPPPLTFTTLVLTDEVAGPHVTPTNIVADIATYSPHAAAGPMHLSALWFDTTYVAKPVADVTAPTGTLTGDTTPTVTWDNILDKDGDSQTYFQVKLFTSAQANPTAASSTNESGIVQSGQRTWTPTVPLADGTWYVYVRVAQTVHGVQHWSDWGSGTATSFEPFTVSIARPGVPSLTLTAESASGRIRVGLAANGATSTDLFETQVSDNGTTWMALRTSEGGGLSTPSGGAATAYDYEAPIGATRYFRARALHIYADGNAASTWSATLTSSWTSPLWWVKNLLDPSLNLTALVRSQPSTTRTGRVGLFQPLDAKYPIAVLDKRSSASGQIVFRLDTDAARVAFEALCDTASVVLIQAPSGVQDWPDRFVALGDYERERVIDGSTSVYSFDSVMWTEVARP